MKKPTFFLFYDYAFFNSSFIIMPGNELNNKLHRYLIDLFKYEISILYEIKLPVHYRMSLISWYVHLINHRRTLNLDSPFKNMIL